MMPDIEVEKLEQVELLADMAMPRSKEEATTSMRA